MSIFLTIIGILGILVSLKPSKINPTRRIAKVTTTAGLFTSTPPS